jgi:hypothetical protein
MSTQQDPYYQMDEVKANLDELEETPNEARLQNWGNQIDSWLDQQMMWLFENNLTVFPLSEQNWIDIGFTKHEHDKLKQFATEGLEQKFWKETNGNEQPYKDWEQKVKAWISDLIMIPATSQVAG